MTRAELISAMDATGVKDGDPVLFDLVESPHYLKFDGVECDDAGAVITLRTNH